MRTEETGAQAMRRDARSGQEAPEASCHSSEYTQTVLHRLSRAIGHLESVKKMVEDGRGCTDVLLQLSAVRGALNSISRIVLKAHMERCIEDAAGKGDYTALEELNRAIDRMFP